MESTVTKFTEEEIKKIKDIQVRYENTIVQFGRLALDRIAIEDGITSLNTNESKLKQEFITLQKDDENLLLELSKKYGEGSLNLKDGTFTPKPK